MKKLKIPKIEDSHKKDLRTAIFFVLGVICTLAITSLWNKALPEQPIIVKEVSDSIMVVHEYKIPQIDDSLEITIKKKLENLELLNNYENEIDNRIKRIENKSKNSVIPNLISLKFSESYEHKGYTQGNANSFFKVDCPNINSTDFIDFKLDFFNPKILAEIAFFRLNIYKFDKISDEDSRSYILNQFYEPYTNNNNFIRIGNNLSDGKYEIMIGFTLKKDLNKKYPDFYMKKCILTKK